MGKKLNDTLNIQTVTMKKHILAVSIAISILQFILIFLLIKD